MTTFRQRRGPTSDASGAPGANTALPGGYILRRAEPADLATTAGIHERFLPVGLFPSMGTRFLRQWHRTFLREPHGTALVVVDSRTSTGEVVGFLLGTTDQKAHAAALMDDDRLLLGLALSGTIALLRRPRLAGRFVRTRSRPWARKLLRRQSSATTGSAGRSDGRVAVLAAVAVESGRHGEGLGTHLVRHFLVGARDAGADLAELTTAASSDGGAAAAFYERLGWRAGEDRQTRDGTTVRTYFYLLRDPSPAEGTSRKENT